MITRLATVVVLVAPRSDALAHWQARGPPQTLDPAAARQGSLLPAEE